MAIARSLLVPPGAEGVYHCACRCVRRAWLCGRDPYSGIDYAHRRQWIKDRLKLLSRGFAVDVCAYAIMSNHLHIVVRLQPELIQSISDEEVAARWLMIFSGGKSSSEPEQARIREIASNKERIKLLRDRLGNLSWFMSSLNENIARRANAEDECKGRFWEGRFSSQPLLDQAGILTCMTYVDLNPIRAGIAETPEDSDFTSVQERIRALLAAKEQEHQQHNKEKFSQWLADINPPLNSGKPGLLSMSLEEYLELLDHTGRILRSDKRGVIPEHLTSILTRLQIEPEKFSGAVKHYGSMFHRLVGNVESMSQSCKKLGLAFVKGIKASRSVFCLKTANH